MAARGLGRGFGFTFGLLTARGFGFLTTFGFSFSAFGLTTGLGFTASFFGLGFFLTKRILTLFEASDPGGTCPVLSMEPITS